MKTIKIMVDYLKKKIHEYSHPSAIDVLNAFGIVEDWGDDLPQEEIAELRKKIDEL